MGGERGPYNYAKDHLDCFVITGPTGEIAMTNGKSAEVWSHALNAAFSAGRDSREEEVGKMRDALIVIAEDDILVDASGGAFAFQALKRRQEVARAALDSGTIPPQPERSTP